MVMLKFGITSTSQASFAANIGTTYIQVVEIILLDLLKFL